MTHQFGMRNVAGSINNFIKNNLGNLAPSWLSWNYGTHQPRTLLFDWPDQPLGFPSFSITHHGNDAMANYQGHGADPGYKSIRRLGSMEINCWVSELVYDDKNQPTGKNYQWASQLRDMRDMVFLLFSQNHFVDLYDVSDPNNLVRLNAIVEIKDVRETPTLPDPNPSVKRCRIMITYAWQERWVA